MFVQEKQGVKLKYFIGKASTNFLPYLAIFLFKKIMRHSIWLFLRFQLIGAANVAS